MDWSLSLLIFFYASGNFVIADENELLRLPDNVIPETYKAVNIHISDVSSDTYEGSELIIFKTTEIVESIMIYSSPEYINITSISINAEPCKWSYNNTLSEILNIACNSIAPNVDHLLYIDYSAFFTTNEDNGLYKFLYQENDVEDVILLTKFAPIYARRVFPCFDEPSFKINFTFSITHPSTHQVLGNTPANSIVVNQDGTITTQFETTPLTSTYSLGFVLFSNITLTEVSKVNESDFGFTLYTNHKLNKFGNTAINYTKNLVTAMGNWSGVKYNEMGTTELTLVTIESLQGNLINDAGLLISSEELVLDELSDTTAKQKQKILTHLSNQIAHEWFGNFISPNWWSNTWISEGFCRFFEYYLSDQVFPGMKIMTHFTTNVVQNALRDDSVLWLQELSSKENDVLTSSEILNNFNDLIANKGASIIRMMQLILGEKEFQKKMKSYINNSKFSITNSTLLLESLGMENKLEEFLYTPGYPLVIVDLAANGSNVSITQEPFLALFDEIYNNTFWNIPISYSTLEENDFSLKNIQWLNKNKSIEIHIKSGSWIILNNQQMGYYRVHYNDVLWTGIIRTLYTDTSKINVLNRAQLIDDIFALASVDKIIYEKAFQLVGYLIHETEYYPWNSAFKIFQTLLRHISDQETQKLLKTTVLNWINLAFPKLNEVTATNHVDIIKENLILNWKCYLGDANCLNNAKMQFEQFKSKMVFQNYNERDITLCYGVKSSMNPMEEYIFLLKVYSDSNSTVEKGDILSSLGCLPNGENLKDYLTEIILEKSVIPKYNAMKIFEAVTSNQEAGVDVALEFLTQNTEKIISKYSHIFLVSDFITTIADKISTRNQYNQIQELVSNYKELQDDSSRRSLKAIENNLKWSEKYSNSIKNALEPPKPGHTCILNSIFSHVIIALVIILCYNKFF